MKSAQDTGFAAPSDAEKATVGPCLYSENSGTRVKPGVGIDEKDLPGVRLTYPIFLEVDKPPVSYVTVEAVAATDWRPVAIGQSPTKKLLRDGVLKLIEDIPPGAAPDEFLVADIKRLQVTLLMRESAGDRQVIHVRDDPRFGFKKGAAMSPANVLKAIRSKRPDLIDLDTWNRISSNRNFQDQLRPRATGIDLSVDRARLKQDSKIPLGKELRFRSDPRRIRPAGGQSSRSLAPAPAGPP